MSVSSTAAALTPAIFQRKGSRDARAPSDEDRTFLRRDTTTGSRLDVPGCSKQTIHREDGHPGRACSPHIDHYLCHIASEDEWRRNR